MGKIIGYKHGEGSIRGVDARLWDIVQHAIAAIPYDAQIRSGAESRGKSDKGNHMEGFAVDVTLYDGGRKLPDTATANKGATFSAYEQYAQAARVYQKQTYPELNDVLRWGGGFSQGGTPGDLMHLDITPSARGKMALYDWDTGLNGIGKTKFPAAISNGGLGDYRRVAMIQQSLAGGPLPPMNIPEVASELSTTRPADGADFYEPRLDAAGNYVGSPNRLRQVSYPADVTSADNAAYGVTIGGLGALTDPRTEALISGPLIDPIGDGPSPIQLLVRHDNERGGLEFSPDLHTPQQAPALNAPTPMPGRPPDKPAGQLDASGQAVAVPPEVATAHGTAALSAPFVSEDHPTSNKAPAPAVSSFTSEDHPTSNKAPAAEVAPTPQPSPARTQTPVTDYNLNEPAFLQMVRERVAKQAEGKSFFSNEGMQAAAVKGMSDQALLAVVKDKLNNPDPKQPLMPAGITYNNGTFHVAPEIVEGYRKNPPLDAGTGQPVNVDKLIADLTIPIKKPDTWASPSVFNGAPANGVVVEHVGERNGRPVLAVSGQASVDRAPPPASVNLAGVPSRITSQMFQPASFLYASPPIQFSFPKTLGEALAGTSYATVASTMDQHFAKTDPVIEDIHDKRETQQVQATRAAPVSTSTVKPQGTVTAPAKPAPAPKMDDVGHPTTWGDFTKTMQVPLPAPAKLVPPAQRTPVAVPARKPSVVTSAPAPTGVGSVSRESGRDVKGGHAANVQPAAAPGVVTAPAPVKTVPQVRELPPVPVKAPTVVAQPTVKTAGAPAPASRGSQATAAAAPIYVDKATGARLAPQTINVFNPDTNQWGQRTVYRPATPSPSAVAQQKADMQSILNSKGFPGSGTSMSV